MRPNSPFDGISRWKHIEPASLLVKYLQIMKGLRIHYGLRFCSRTYTYLEMIVNGRHDLDRELLFDLAQTTVGRKAGFT